MASREVNWLPKWLCSYWGFTNLMDIISVSCDNSLGGEAVERYPCTCGGAYIPWTLFFPNRVRKNPRRSMEVLTHLRAEWRRPASKCARKGPPPALGPHSQPYRDDTFLSSSNPLYDTQQKFKVTVQISVNTLMFNESTFILQYRRASWCTIA